MIDFPVSTTIHKRMPKEAFYKRLTLSAALMEKFVADVERIMIENSLSNDSLNLTAGAEIKEILLLSIVLKKEDFDGKVVEAIARQNPHKLLFLLTCGDRQQLSLYHNKLYRTEWMSADEISLKLNGLSLDEIWNSFIEQIALYEERAENADTLSIDERLALQEQITKLEKLIKKTEAAAWKEQQPKKKFELYSKLKDYKRKLEELKKVTQ
ncbi:MAG: DUF4391 domain-containing protein [Clostridia bacterium]|nr:DUF4391 domain-containing protein [Clostridia bacterium]